MAVDREFDLALEAWAKKGWSEEQDRLAAEGAARADRWARMTTFVPYSSMQHEEVVTDAKPDA